MKKSLHRINGRITAVQENRFRMVDDLGRGFLFSLSHSTSAGQADLQRWHDGDVPVMVAFSGEPNLATGIAHRVEPLG